MYVNLIYENNKYEFDVPKGATISYIKELTSKIFRNEKKDLNLIFNDENLSNYDDKFFINKLVPEGVKNIIIHLEKPDNGKTHNISSNVSTSDTNDINDKYYNSMKKKFMKFNSTYSKVLNGIFNFNLLLEENIESIFKSIRELKNNVLRVNERLNSFYNSKSYDRLIEVFDKNQNVGITEKDLEKLNREIESYVINYKYLITQYNFQVNIIEFIKLELENFKNIKLKCFRVEKLNDYNEIVLALNKIFTEFLIENNKSRNNNLEDEFLNSEYYHTEINKNSNIINNLKEKEKKPSDNKFPKIRSRVKKISPNLNYYLTESEKTSNQKPKIKLSKKEKFRESSSFSNLLFLPQEFSSKNSKTLLTSNSINVSSPTKNILPGIDSIKNSNETKTIDSSQILTISSSESKFKKQNRRNTTFNLKEEFTEKYSRNYRNSILINNKQNQSMNIEIKPKIMDKNSPEKIKKNNIGNNNNTLINKNEEKNDNEIKGDNINLIEKKLKKINPLDNSNSFSSISFLENKSIYKSEKSRVEDMVNSKSNIDNNIKSKRRSNHTINEVQENEFEIETKKKPKLKVLKVDNDKRSSQKEVEIAQLKSNILNTRRSELFHFKKIIPQRKSTDTFLIKTINKLDSLTEMYKTNQNFFQNKQKKNSLNKKEEGQEIKLEDVSPPDFEKKKKKEKTFHPTTSINIDAINETLDEKKNLNNKEQIDKLTKDLSVRRRSVFSKINTSDTIKPNNNNIKEIKTEVEKKPDKDNLIINELEPEKINNNSISNTENKKKKRRGVNRYDFIV